MIFPDDPYDLLPVAAFLTHRCAPLILGSRSPRRRELLLETGFRFGVLPSADGAEEAAEDPELDAKELAKRLSLVKARSAAERLAVEPEALEPGDEKYRAALTEALAGTVVVLACDSVAECDGEILGKPDDRADAERMLRKLSGSVHAVHTGLTLLRVHDRQPARAPLHLSVQTSVLEMDPLSEEDLIGYLDSGLWEGKAGAFGYQDGNDWLRIISGSESNVVGLPVEALAAAIVRLKCHDAWL